ncbi:MAG: hypothetical protein ABI565_12730 [Vicinamibacteria bacterium]
MAQAGKLMTAVYEAFKSTDASLLEVNPLIVTEEGALVALDAKMTFDDNALYRHPDIKELRDVSEEEPLDDDPEIQLALDLQSLLDQHPLHHLA